MDKIEVHDGSTGDGHTEDNHEQSCGGNLNDQLPGLESETDQTSDQQRPTLYAAPEQTSSAAQDNYTAPPAQTVESEVSATAPEAPVTSATPSPKAKVAKQPGDSIVSRISHLNAHYVIEGVLALVVIILAVWGAGLSSDNSKLTSDKNNLQSQLNKVNANPQAVIQQQTNDLISKVGKLTKLPTGETPTVANVTDATAAKKQSAFFNNAQDGDKVLMYVKAGEAVLYRPSTNKVILVAPLSISSTPNSSSASR